LLWFWLQLALGKTKTTKEFLAAEQLLMPEELFAPFLVLPFCWFLLLMLYVYACSIFCSCL
jgi:hypothetical protein